MLREKTKKIKLINKIKPKYVLHTIFKTEE